MRIPSWAVVAALATLVSFAAVGAVLVFVRRKAILAIPNARSSHTVPTPSGGGLGIVAAILLSGFALARAFTPPWTMAPTEAAPMLAAAILLAAATGFVDDRRALRVKPKMLLIVAAAALALPSATIHAVDMPWYGRLELGPLAIPLSLLWLVGFTNAFNFMDGINGIAGVTLVISGAALAVAGARRGDTDTLWIGTLMAGGAAGFLPWNFPRAKIFMGDAGALPLGLLLGVAALHASRDDEHKTPASLPFLACALLLGPYLFDVSLTLFRRWHAKKPLVQAHREHLYQHLARGFGSHVPATLAVGGVEICAAWLAVTYGSRGDVGKTLSLVLPAAAFLALAQRIIGWESRTTEGG